MSGPFTKPEGVEELHIAIEAPEGFYKLKKPSGVIIIDRPSSNGFIKEAIDKNKTRIFISIHSRIHNGAILAALTEALGSHVISVLRQYPERAAEYLRNWHTECRIYHDRCVVTRRGEVIAEGVF